MCIATDDYKSMKQKLYNEGVIMAYVNNVWVGQTEQDNYEEEMYSRKANGLQTISFDDWKKQKEMQKDLFNQFKGKE